MTCNTRNAARSAAAEALAAGLRRHYRGRLVRELVGGQRFDLDLGGRLLSIVAEIVRTTARGPSVQVDATAEVPRR